MYMYSINIRWFDNDVYFLFLSLKGHEEKLTDPIFMEC